jgi:Tfp pilus assembly protein PilX
VNPCHPARGERGIALIMAMLALLVLSLAVAGIMMTLNTDTKVAGHQLRDSQAFYVAEAGIAEAETRIRLGDVPNNLNPHMVAQIFNQVPGSVPVLGADSTALATAQPAGGWMDYSTDSPSDRVLTVSYKTNTARTQIYRYDSTKNPAVQTTSGFPIFTIRSTGMRGQNRVTIVEDVMQRPFNVNVRAALAAQVGIDFSGNSDVCGYNHSINTPAGTKGRGPCLGYELGYGNLAGGWSCGSIASGGSSTQNGVPPTLGGQTGFYNGPWECLGMSQAEFFTWVGTPFATEVNPPRGIIYHDNDAITQNRTGSWHYNGGTGEGFLYFDGDVTINGNFNYVGLIYVEGDLKINGTCWILGGMIVKGVTTIKIANGACTILYSADAIQEKISKYGGSMVKLSWREAS